MERQAAQVVIKDPSLLGATPTRTIPVLVLHNNAAEDSDNTVVYDDVEVEGEDSAVPPGETTAQKEQPTSEKGEAQQKDTVKQKPKVKGSLKVKRYVIRRPKQKKKSKKFKCIKCVNRYESIKTLNRHFRKRHRKMRCPDCGKSCTTPESLRHHAYDHSVGDRFACKNCGEKFVFKSYLKVHLLKHKGKPTFTCPIVNCKKKFTYKGELARHSKEHENVSWICRRCNYETDMERKL